MTTLRSIGRSEKLRPYLLLLPLMLIMLLIFAAGLAFGTVQSFGWFPAIGLREITFEYYREVLRDPTFLGSLRFSLYTSLTASILSAVFGVGLSYVILTTGRKRGGPLPSLFKSPVYVPHIVVALFIFVLLTQSGLIARLLSAVGLLSDMNEFPRLIFDKNGIGIMVAYIWKELPFMTYITYDVLRTLDERYSMVAGTLGAGKWQVMRRVILPQLWPSIVTGFVLIFAYAFGSYEVPLLLGPTIPRALPVLSYIYYSSVDMTQHVNAMVVNMIITLGILLILALGKLLEKLLKKAGGYA